MSALDARGNPVGTASAQALAHAEKALWRLVSFFDAPLADLDAAAGSDPAWAGPQLLRAGFLLSLTEPGLKVEIEHALARARVLVRGAPQREHAHLAALERCAAGDWHGACAAWGRLLEAHPRDLAALQWAHLFDFHRGDPNGLRERPRRVLPHWERDDPLRPYVLGMHAFGLEECGAYAEAEAAGREAVAGEARVPWATHAVAHVMEMQGRFEDGIAWLEARRADWSEGNGFAGHHWWHLALFHLERLDLAAALALYDAHLSSPNNALTLQRLDGAALLWRLHLLGAGDLAPRWRDVAVGWDFAPAGAGHCAFNDVHTLLVLLGLGRRAEAAAWLDAVEAQAAGSDTSNREMARRVGVPFMRGLLAFDRGEFAQAVRWIAPVRALACGPRPSPPEAARGTGGRTPRIPFGGSHAQRDLITQTLLAAAAGAGEDALGMALLHERRTAKPRTPLTAHWERRFT